MNDARLLTEILREPSRAAAVEDWTSLICVARAESLIGSLAHRLEHQALPDRAALILQDARADAGYVALAVPLKLAFALALPGLVATAQPAGAQSLSEALAQAYSNNPTLLTARAQLRSTDENVPQALAGWRPTVSITSSAGVSPAR